MFRFLHLADLHLGWEPRNLDPEKAKERSARRDGLLERAVEFALGERLELVVIAGDLFETHRPEPRLVQRTLAQLRRLGDAGIQVITTPGNHDEVTYADSVYHQVGPEWPGHLVLNPLPEHVRTLELGGETVNIYSLAYTGGVTPVQRPLSDFPRRDEPGFHLALFHGTLGSADERSLPLDRDALERAGYDYVALGHIHQASETRLGRTLLVYSGCQEGKGFDDPGVANWTVVTVRSGAAELTRVPLAVQRIHSEDVDLTECEAEEDVERRVEALADADAMVRLRLIGSLHFPLDAEKLAEKYRPLFWFLEVRDESDAVGEALLDEWAAERTIRGTFVRRMRDELAAASLPEERRKVVRALRYGIRAFRGAA